MGKYAKLLRRATESVDYWAQIAMRSFVSDLANRMESQDIKRADLAQKIASSPAYVTKVMRGEANFTLETMTKLAMAVGGRLHVTIIGADEAVTPIDVSQRHYVFAVAPRRPMRTEQVSEFALEMNHLVANDWHQHRGAPVAIDAANDDQLQAA